MTSTAPQALPVDDCHLDRPCGLCATLTPAARSALAETLAGEASPARPVEQSGRAETLLRWDHALSEQASQLESATAALADSDFFARWREACTDFLAIEIAKTVGLVVAAPAGAHISRAGAALAAARTARDAALPQP